MVYGAFAMSPEPVVTARGLVKHFPQRRGLPAVAALDGVDIAIAPGATLALVGESGSGKSTLARCLAGFEKPDAGEIRFSATAGGPGPAAQLVFQDAAGSLNPGMRAANIVAEPLFILGRGNAADRRRRVAELMTVVGLPAAAERLPHQFSGGQRQRLAIARALAADPALLILDEALSGLDLSMQAQIANLLAEVQRQRGLAYLFISHDLPLACRVADEIAVMQAGRIVERGTPGALLAGPQHPHTRALIAAVPEAPCAT
jgi:ABC-type glutathione transport system ATPase component